MISHDLNITTPTWATLFNSGSNQSTLHSQWLSRNVNTSPVALSAPFILDLTNPCIYIIGHVTSHGHNLPSLWSLRNALTLGNFSNNSPSLAVMTLSITMVICTYVYYTIAWSNYNIVTMISTSCHGKHCHSIVVQLNTYTQHSSGVTKPGPTWASILN